MIRNYDNLNQVFELLTSNIKITILYTYNNCIRMVLWLTGEVWRCVIVVVDFVMASPVANKFNVIRDVEVGCNENDNTCFLKFENLVYCIESLYMTILCERGMVGREGRMSVSGQRKDGKSLDVMRDCEGSVPVVRRPTGHGETA